MATIVAKWGFETQPLGEELVAARKACARIRAELQAEMVKHEKEKANLQRAKATGDVAEW